MKAKMHVRMIAAIMVLAILLTTLPVITFAQEPNTADYPEQIAAELKLDDAKIIGENTARRSEYEKHFKLDDGTYLAAKYGYPIHTQNEAGEWEDIDLSFAANENAGSNAYISESDVLSSVVSSGTMQLASAENTHPVSLTLTDSDMVSVSEEKAVDGAEEQPEENADGEDIYNENIKIIEEATKSAELCFTDFYRNTELIYERTYSGIRQNIAFAQKPEDGNLSFDLNTGDLTAYLNDSGNVEIRDRDDIKYILPAPYMHDSQNKHFSSLQYTLEKTENGKYILAVNADSELLNSKDISYPVTISAAAAVPYDAAVRIVAVSSGDAKSAGEDVTIGKISEDNISRAFWKSEEVPMLAEDDIMLSTHLHTYQYTGTHEGNSFELQAYSITEEWNGDDLTWDNQPACSDEQKKFSLREKDGMSTSIVWDITKEIRDSYEDSPSYGIVLMSSDEATNGAAYFPTNYGGELCPYMLVNYVSVSQSIGEDDFEPVETETESNDSQQSSDINTDIDIAADAVDTADNASGDVVPYAADKTFKEITSELKIEYCTDSKEVWTTLPSGRDVENLCGVRISTNSSNFYLEYKSKNVDKGWLSPVSSTKSGIYDYAGLAGRPMTNLSISVYTSNTTRIYDDYVVMYRAKVAGRWLEWVSNGWPDIMQTIKSEAGLSGNLDTQHTDAGWEALGSIQALEIRMFERISGNSSSGGSTAPVEAGDFQLASGITMKYRQTGTGTWTAFGVNDTVSFSDIDGIMLEAPGKPYYFRYAAKDNTTGWNPYVLSSNADVNDHANGYAGYANRPITNIAIEVHTAGSRVYDNYIVMYRAKAGGKWLPWVSNGWPDIMKTLMPDAELDTKSTNAGDGRYGAIQALEIRVYERKGMSGQKPTHTGSYTIDAPYINQKAAGVPNGCESVSTVMALQHAVGKDKISLTSFLNNYLDWTPTIPSPSRNIGPNPNKVYMGSPFPNCNDNSWGCFSPVIMNAVCKLENTLGVKATDVSGASLRSLCTDYIDNGIPVIMWATVGMTSSYKIHSWVTSDGASISYNSKLHCLLLVGYDNNNYYFNDPLACQYCPYSKASVEAAYAALGKQAIVITKTSGGQAVDPIKNETVKEPEEINKKPAMNDEYHADPIDLSTGAHVIDHTLMTVSGAQTLSFNISYRSNVLTDSSVGKGWSHNFEKSIEDKGDVLLIYDSPAYFAIFEKTDSDSNVFKSNTITKQNYTATRITDGMNTSYAVNCNDQYTEYYDHQGRLTKITTKIGFSTLITYPDDNTVKITDEISGRYIQLTKNRYGKITSVSDNSGRSCTLGYIDECLASITDENGDCLSYQYNEKGQVVRGRDQNGIIYFTNTYDSSNRVISQNDSIVGSNTTVINYDDITDPDYRLVTVTDRTVQTTVYKYNSNKQLVSKTDPNGVEIKYEYDSHGNLSKKTDGLGNSVVNIYDARDNLISSTDRNGNTTLYDYDSKNNIKKVTYSDGSYVNNSYNINNQLAASKDLRKAITRYNYDENGLLIKKTCAGRTVEYTYDKGQPITVTDSLGRMTSNVYNEAGFLISSTDADGNTTSYTYDNKGNVLTVTDAAGNVASKEYDASGSLIKSTDVKGNVTSYTYNGNLKMTSMTLPNGAVIHYEYDGEDRLAKTIYPDGTEAVNAYDAGGRLISHTDREGNTVSYEYDAANNVVKTINPEGGVIQKEYDANGNLIKSLEPLTIYDPYYDFDYPEDYDEDDMEWVMSNVTVTTSYTYDTVGHLIKSVNSQGGETVYTYNAAGDLLTVTDPMGGRTVNTYDSFGNLLSVTDPRGNMTYYTYDTIGNLLTIENALGQITTNTYDSMNRLVSTKDPGDHVISYEYDVLGRMTSVTDAKGNTTTQEYDALGNIVKITNASGHVDYQAVYDSMGKATEITNAAGSKTTNVYDWKGNLTKETNALNQSASYTYNGAGQMISAIDRAGGISYATYDGMGNLTSVTGPGGNVKEYVYDSTGRMYRKGSVNTDYKDSYYYNAAGLLNTVATGFYHYETNYTYDAAGRVTEAHDNVGVKKYTYDENGNVTALSDATGTVRREYDALNRVIKYTDIYGRVINYEYDCCGNLSKMTHPTGEVAVYTYDANHNMLSSGVEGDDCTTTYEYNKQNQVTKIHNIDGGVVEKDYDSAGRLQRLSDRDKNGKFLYTNFFTYDVLGRITSELNPITMIDYRMTYDELGRLTQRTEYDARYNEVIRTESFTYDSAGNILSATSPDGTENTYQYGENNFISSMNGGRIVVDRVGNTTSCMINGKTANITYDSRNRLKKIDGDINEYWYDPDNNRINMYYYHTNMQYLYDSSDGRSRLIWTSDHNENVTSYFYGAEGLLWSRCNGEYQVYHYDYRGSVVAVTDVDGNVTDTLKYDAYGSITERTGDSKLIFTYNGQYGVLTDPNGLLYMRTRFYNPQLKRFMNADILDGDIADSTTLNLYTYVNGNPISYVDPFGMSVDTGRGGQSSSNSVPEETLRSNYYRLGGMELAPKFGPYDNDFPYDPNEKMTYEDYVNFYVWYYGFSSISGLPVSIKQKLKGIASKFPEIYEQYECELDTDLSDATKAYRHYLNGSGKSMKINYEKAYNECSKIQSVVDSQLLFMRKAVNEFYSLGAGTEFEIIGDLIMVSSELGSENWDKTIGQHYMYGYGKVYIDPTTKAAKIDATFTMEDMYNFNKNQNDIATGTSDNINGRFQTIGIAKQFITYGSFSLSEEWRMR